MTLQLIIGNKNYSSWSMRPWLLLRHFEIPFSELSLSLSSDRFDQTISQYSAAGKVPVLLDNGIIIWDSLAICEYINEQYLAGRAYPKEVAARAICRSACAEMHSSFSLIRSQMPLNCRARKHISFGVDLQHEIRRIDTLWQQLRKTSRNQGEWLFGQFSIADAMFAPMASRFDSYQPVLSETSHQYIHNIRQHPDVKDWYQQSRQETEIITQSEVGERVQHSHG